MVNHRNRMESWFIRVLAKNLKHPIKAIQSRKVLYCHVSIYGTDIEGQTNQHENSVEEFLE